MSKAFTKENEQDLDDDTELAEPAMPVGTKNYITPHGFKKLKDELHHLLYKERPALTTVIAWAASNGDRSENADYIYGKRRLREIDKKIRFLTKRLEIAEVVDPAAIKAKQVLFGATVTIEDEEGTQKVYSIVGIDEVNLPKNQISWISPLAKALLKGKVGDVVTFKTPKGVREYEIIKIKYE